MGTAVGRHKQVAAQIGVTYEEYLARQAAGEKWCWACERWQLRSEFQLNRSARDGLQGACRESKRGTHKPKLYSKQERARSAIKYAMRAGRIPRAKDLPCTDCGHVIGDEPDRRHEYDHYLGYEPEHWLDIEPVCSTCHADRELARGKFRRQRTASEICLDTLAALQDRGCSIDLTEGSRSVVATVVIPRGLAREAQHAGKR